MIDIRSFFQSKIFLGVLYGIGAVVIVLVIFMAGVGFGRHEGRFSCRFGDNYYRNFVGPRDSFMKDFGWKNINRGHGIQGSIIKIDADVLIIKDQNNTEKSIIITSKTVINKGRNTLEITDLKLNDNIVIIGSPNESGQIEAQLIRVFDAGFPPPPSQPGMMPPPFQIAPPANDK